MEKNNGNMVCAKFAYISKHGTIGNKIQNSIVKYYNLDEIIS